MMREIETLGQLRPDTSGLQLSDVWSVVDSIAESDPRYKVRLITFHSGGDCSEIFRRTHIEGFEVVRHDFSDFWTFDLTRTVSRSNIEGGRRVVSGSFGLFKANSTGIWTAFTSEGPDFFSMALTRFIEECRPQISFVHLTSDQLRQLFERLEAKSGCEVWVRKAVVYSHREEGEIGFKKKPARVLFNFAEREDDYVDKVEYVLQSNGEATLHAFASRDGVSYFFGGRMGYFTDMVLPAFAEEVSQSSELLAGRQRDSESGGLNPLAIVYKRNVFGRPEDNSHLIRALGNLDRSGLAVLHRNPYVHAAFLDFVDGSTFDIFVTGQNRISIIPGYQSSVYSLERLTEQIFKDFHEGKVEEDSQPSYTLSDFLTE